MRVTQKRGGIAEDDGCAMYEGYVISVLPKQSIVTKRKRKRTPAGTVIILLLRRKMGRDAGLLFSKPAILCRVTWFPFDDNRGFIHVNKGVCIQRS